MTQLSDLFNVDEFFTDVDLGYIRLQYHDTLPFAIANYAEKAQFESRWTPEIRQCRGLIFGRSTLEVVSRPYAKFFNYGDEHGPRSYVHSDPVVVTDKVDGSLGISYPTPDGLAVATRGSFNSEQAKHATQLLHSKYPQFRGASEYTYLWEIVYPENRIVVDYGGTDDLILHGVVHNATGVYWSPRNAAYQWPGPVTEHFEYRSLRQALEAPPRAGKEGLVVRFPRTNDLVKIKQADYVALHRIVTGLSERTVWEWLGEGKTVAELCSTLPDEFHLWVEEVATRMNYRARSLVRAGISAHKEIERSLDSLYGNDWTRGDYARAAAQRPKDVRPYLFLELDNNRSKARDLAWRSVKPSGVTNFAKENAA